MDNKHKRSYKQHSEKITADDFARAPTTVDKKWTAFSSLAGITESNSPVDPNNPVSAEVVVDEDEENRRIQEKVECKRECGMSACCRKRRHDC